MKTLLAFGIALLTGILMTIFLPHTNAGAYWTGSLPMLVYFGIVLEGYRKNPLSIIKFLASQSEK